MTLCLFIILRGVGGEELSDRDSIFHTVGKICTMEMFYAALKTAIRKLSLQVMFAFQAVLILRCCV